MATRVHRLGIVMLVSRETIEARVALAAGPLSPLVASLSADLDRLLPDEDVFVPAEKAKMTRRGGRCPRDGTLLEFDPLSPRAHRCPACGSVQEGDDHYRWWIMGYQLWLAERAVHAAALWRLTGTARYRRLAEAILVKYSGVYASYPDEDNVLGPTRVFFSTYLESIWSLQLAVAVSLLEPDGATSTGDLVRDRILTPSSELVGSFNEGLSNRQVWNAAALGAAGVLLDRDDLVERALFGSGGAVQFLQDGLLDDGTWYEGENYHLFAHRGVWYLTTLARHVGAVLPGDALRRFEDGFTAPLRTALPDFTFPSRRDSQYRASLRQWRIAESLELGLARNPSSTGLAAGLSTLYGGDALSGDTSRWRSTAEAERNVPGVRLTRADLGWKSLLFALPQLPTASPEPPGSALLEGQGFGVIRREQGRVYVALDYGHTGGSHGHPDRLNLWLVVGNRRVFEDVGTGSYVERSLHWYRSTLAHNAPLVDGRSQDAVAGSLRAWDERDDLAWIDAESSIADGVLVRRTMIVAEGHLVDRLEWRAHRDVTLDLPMHIDGDVEGVSWRPGTLVGGAGLEDGFDFVQDAETAELSPATSRIAANDLNGAVCVDVAYDWWRAVAPGPPGHAARRFLMIRARGARGRLTSAWSWKGPVELRVTGEDTFDATIAGVRFTHGLVADAWQVQRGEGVPVILAGRRSPRPPAAVRASTRGRTRDRVTIPMVHRREVAVGDLLEAGEGVRFELGEAHYRRTEQRWAEAGSPTATVMIAATAKELLIEVSVDGSDPNFAPARTENPLDNEHPDVNSDGVQLHLTGPDHTAPPRVASWLLVPERAPSVRSTPRDDATAIPMNATWRAMPGGWQLLARIDRSALGPADAPIALDVIVNETPRWRERRRGQLVLSGGAGDWAYLRGDRQDPERLIPMVVRHG